MRRRPPRPTPAVDGASTATPAGQLVRGAPLPEGAIGWRIYHHERLIAEVPAPAASKLSERIYRRLKRSASRRPDRRAVTVSWTAVTGATGYRVYRTSSRQSVIVEGELVLTSQSVDLGEYEFDVVEIDGKRMQDIVEQLQLVRTEVDGRTREKKFYGRVRLSIEVIE